MPFINISLSGSELSHDQKKQLFHQTTELMHEVMHKKKELTSVRIQLSESCDWAIGSRLMNEGKERAVYMDIKVTEGTNTAAEKSEMIKQSILMLKHVVGPIAAASYVVIHDIAGDSWGYDGLTQQARAQGQP